MSAFLSVLTIDLTRLEAVRSKKDNPKFAFRCTNFDTEIGILDE